MLKIIATAKIKKKIYATAKIARSIISVPDYVYISAFKINQLNSGNVIRADDNIIVDYSFVVNKPQLIGYFEVLIDGNVVYTKNTIDSNPITLPPISDGSYSMTMKVYDLSGNEIAETVVYPFQVQVAIQAPIVPNQIDWTFSSMRSVNALQGATDPQGLPLSLDSIVNVTNGSAIIVGNNIEITRNDLQPTIVTFVVTNGFKSTQATARMDWQALNLTITQPTPQDVIDDGDSVTVDYFSLPSSPETLSHIQKYELYLDGVLQSGMTINNIQAGSRVLRVDAIDTRNNVVATDSVTITVNAAANLLLDLYPGAVLARDFFKLSSTYNGNCIRVFRASDSQEFEVGFATDYIGKPYLDVNYLLSLYNGSAIYGVRTYDQSGNGNDLYATAETNMPMIVDAAGNLVSDGLFAMIDFDGVDDFLQTAVGLDFGSDSRSIFSVQKADLINTGVILRLSQAETNGSDWTITSEIAVRAWAVTWFSSTPISTSNISLISNIYTGGTLHAGNSMWIDGDPVAKTSGNDGAINTGNSPVSEGRRLIQHSPFDGKKATTLIYKSDQTANRAAIENIIMSNYGMV